MQPSDQPPTLEQQLAAQEQLRQAAAQRAGAQLPGTPEADRSWAIGCLSVILISAVSILLWMVIGGAALAWWMWLRW